LTNPPEGLNNPIETLCRKAGGHFHSEREALVKLKLLADQLYDTAWRHSTQTQHPTRPHDPTQLAAEDPIPESCSPPASGTTRRLWA